MEFKMYHKGLIPLLLTLLERDNDDLLVHVVSFLKKMSIFKENKEEMVCMLHLNSHLISLHGVVHRLKGV